jgi:hypothetical protein
MIGLKVRLVSPEPCQTNGQLLKNPTAQIVNFRYPSVASAQLRSDWA